MGNSLGPPLGASNVSSPPGGSQERSWTRLGVDLAGNRAPRAKHRVPGSILGAINNVFCVTFGVSAACVFLALLGSIFLSSSFSSLGLFHARAKGAQADHTVKTNGFCYFFNFRLRAGERRGKQKTNATTSKNNTNKR